MATWCSLAWNACGYTYISVENARKTDIGNRGAVVVPKLDVEHPLNEANKGFRLLQNMGWKEGKGPGKGEQGRQEPNR
ncbi:hypothetical protein KIN20_032433 [Parelaphostrongylus tenuis]|uniref:G-patch domain-containing protein n=1 Tax=Parelaphostrongylus tenuis TaxID=148309 RepID=A0AAD5WHI0_PARTN|nr:hypothetical protein KIN20_032433 [Parelaphostrongylus tenuis]